MCAANVIWRCLRCTPSARRATTCVSSLGMLRLFQSTPSARRATDYAYAAAEIIKNFNPRPPRGGRHCLFRLGGALIDFNPRPPRGGRRKTITKIKITEVISIHALREEGDGVTFVPGIYQEVFQSTPSARRATILRIKPMPRPTFQSTPSARRATSYCRKPKAN